MILRRSVILGGFVPGLGGFKINNLKVLTSDNLSVLVRCLTNVKLSEQPIKYCSIKKLEVNQELSRLKLDKRDHLDKCVTYILKEDIQVPELTLMLNKPSWVFGQSRRHAQIPDEVKRNKWSPIDNELIRNNMDILVKAIRQTKNKDAVIENICRPKIKLQWHTEKTNIIGCFLGQGLPDLRLPCEIFQRADSLFNENEEVTKRIVFTESDDRKIVEYMAKNAESDRTPYSSLSKMLGYPRTIIHKRYTKILQPGGKVVTGRFTKKEDREIMETIFEENENALNHYFASSDPMWDKLGTKLNRRPYSLYLRWEGVIKPQVLMYQNGVDHLDFRPILIDYFIEKGILFRNETNWSEIVKDQRFKGTTPHFLQRKYCNLVSAVKKTNPGIEDDDVTSELLLQYLDHRSHNPTKNYYSRLISDYVTIKNSF